MPSRGNRFVPYDSRVVTGFHGTTHERAERAVAEQQLRPSKNKYDWLGHGTYFWEESYSRARQWAEQKYGPEARVVQAKVRLGRCLDMMNTNWAPAVKDAYERVVADYAARGVACPENRGGYRVLDCRVMNELAGNILNAETVRAAFLEGAPVVPTSLFVGLAHIQLVTREPKNILGPLEICEG